MQSALKRFTGFTLISLSIAFLFFSCQKNATARTVSGNSKVNLYDDVQYGSNIDLTKRTVALKLDVYVPANAADNETFPMVLYVHGGGFVEGDKNNAATFMEKFADSNFIAVSIDYRLNSDYADSSACSADSTLTKAASYMAVQDTRAALRFMVANAAKYHVDTTKIFLSGNSAGAITVLNAYYLTQVDFNKLIPGAKLQLGGIDDADNTLTNTYTIKGIAANSGGLASPKDISIQNVLPTIFFHGENDNVVPIDSGNTYNCAHSQYIYGSRSLYNRIVALGQPTVIHIDPNGGHLSYDEDFLNFQETCFFRSILNNEPETGSYSANESSCK